MYRFGAEVSDKVNQLIVAQNRMCVNMYIYIYIMYMVTQLFTFIYSSISCMRVWPNTPKKDGLQSVTVSCGWRCY